MAVELAVALRIGSVSLLADSADFFEDAAVNFLILAALNWSAARRAMVGVALAVNLFCAFALARHRAAAGSLSKAAFLSARNDAIANIGIIAAGLLTIPTRSIWPDLVVGPCIAAMNLDAAREVKKAAREEAADARA
ncbi:hypothetical protein [uncultured Caulobacter sp.]|uniref:hypothetical protein n=1 Tax=uncultured Caulobacter sp. TaxID=158749 RepID=UPI00262503FF|nr:hypothetical protein [uncultured Caulobacter sp.]